MANYYPSIRDFKKSVLNKKGINMVDALPILKGFTLGSDPEFFICDSAGNFVSPEGLIPGSKSSPHPVKFGAIQRDGFAAEINTDPASTYAEWERNHTAVIKQLEDMLPEGLHLSSTLRSVTIPSEIYDKSSLEIRELGCDPDINAWSGEINPPPNIAASPTLRCVGGHVHVGWTNDASMSDEQHVLNCCELVQQMDWFLGGWSVAKDPDLIRKSLYGKAGACRYKHYGVEYRVLSNFWVSDQALRLAVWNRAVTAISMMSKIFIPEKLGPKINGELRQYISEGHMSKGNRHFLEYPLDTLDTKLKHWM